MGPTLREKVEEWVAEYPAIKDHGWTQPEIAAMADSLWDFLADEIGPVQEKLLTDLDLARQRAEQAERNELRVIQDLERYVVDHSSS